MSELQGASMNRYDWSRLDAGWSYEPNTGCGGVLRNSDGSAVTVEYLEGWDDCGQFTRDARAQLAKCRIRDTEPAPAEQWTTAQSRQMGATYDHGSMVAAYGAPPPPKWEVKSFDLPEDLVVLGYQPPPPPWRRGPLASWTLVNISAHDGRLTVVMKRGRGELIDETGPDDDALWERLAAKVVDYEKAKHTPK